MAAIFPFSVGKVKARESKQIVAQIKDLDDAIDVMKKLQAGEWPYPNRQPVTAWDRSRLHMLTQDLNHTDCMPLLYAATKLKQKVFSDIVYALERFVFRYKIICKQHIGPASKIYYKEAKSILANSKGYRTGPFIRGLKSLLDDRTSDDLFREHFTQLRYSPRGKNRTLKYLLATVEDHWRWHVGGASGKPKCKDKSRVFDLANTTIDHIYPQSASGKAKKAPLELLKHTLGNLTILGPEDNVKAGDSDYEKKLVILRNTQIAMNQDLPNTWTKKSIMERQKQICDAAVRVFSL